MKARKLKTRKEFILLAHNTELVLIKNGIAYWDGNRNNESYHALKAFIEAGYKPISREKFIELVNFKISQGIILKENCILS